MSKFISTSTIENAVKALRGTAGVYFLNWLVYKQMGWTNSTPIEIDTGNSKDALERLFGYGDPTGRFYFPVAPSTRFLTYASDASRSVVQTNTRQWLDGTGTINPNGLFEFVENDQKRIVVSAQRSYPQGLGLGRDGFAHVDGARVAVPLTAWSIWYLRQAEIPEGEDPTSYITKQALSALGITPAEAACIFIDDGLTIDLSAQVISEEELYRICSDSTSDKYENVTVVDSPSAHRERIGIMQTTSTGPSWLTVAPSALLAELMSAGVKALLLTGPPRTGKTKAIRDLVGQEAQIIQIHDGWTYDLLVQGQVLDQGQLVWEDGPLLKALRSNTKYIVLDEVNRTRISQAMGELFSLIETAYRGDKFSVTLRKPDDHLSVSEDTVLLFTMNTLDKSTEDIDDALFGRLRAIEFPPRVESLIEILDSNDVGVTVRDKLLRFFVGVQEHYPLGHGYFAEFNGNSNVVTYYLTAIRPVLANHFEAYEPQTLEKIDTLFDEVVVKDNG